MACGGMMVIISIVMLLYGGDLWAGLILLLGALLILIGKKMG